jgi:hypothetical protein
MIVSSWCYGPGSSKSGWLIAFRYTHRRPYVTPPTHYLMRSVVACDILPAAN